MRCRLTHVSHYSPFIVKVFIVGRQAINEICRSTVECVMIFFDNICLYSKALNSDLLVILWPVNGIPAKLLLETMMMNALA